MLMTGDRDEQLSLHGVKSGEEIVERAKTYIANRCPKPGEWIVGVGFDHSTFTMPRMPPKNRGTGLSTV
jgi:predicted amidohydrolase YtcJ